ncbi:hypothetical protein BRADI_1g11277v3 [Brachypodium distachyon]|uniref:Reverse transcriptase zinc-binding domain-containing protein n=1 Tax=Brachypodium distachyon TaxID=15368 RepID=A0A2K2DIZ8_BRADI|nr:hypothetical protein BRADI_1g11277v3 [Brachypodium distachyon]
MDKINNDNYSCVLCSTGEEESLDHLFVHYSFSTRCWRHLQIMWPANTSFLEVLPEVKTRFQSKLFFEIFGIGAWNIWKQRNNLIFEGIVPSFEDWKHRVKADLILLGYGVPNSLSTLLRTLISRV